MTIAPEARAALVPLLGGDRLASRSELQKLALYAHGKQRVEIEDVAAVVTDASALALDALVDATFAGKLADVEFQYTKARNAGTSVGAILFGVARHAGLLHKARLAVDDGQSVDSAVGGLWLHFSRVPLAQAALAPGRRRACRPRSARSPTRRLQSRLNADLSEAIVQRLLLSMAMARGGRDGRSPDGAKRNPGRPPRIALRSMRATSRLTPRSPKFHGGSIATVPPQSFGNNPNRI